MSSGHDDHDGDGGDQDGEYDDCDGDGPASQLEDGGPHVSIEHDDVGVEDVLVTIRLA